MAVLIYFEHFHVFQGMVGWPARTTRLLRDCGFLPSLRLGIVLSCSGVIQISALPPQEKPSCCSPRVGWDNGPLTAAGKRPVKRLPRYAPGQPAAC